MSGLYTEIDVTATMEVFETLQQILAISGNVTLTGFMLWRIVRQDNELDRYREWFVRRQERIDDRQAVTDKINTKELQ